MGDHFTRKAKEQGYAARSVYKLEAMDRKYGLFRPGQRVLDLGCHPGSWSKYVSARVGEGGYVLGVDLTPTKSPAPWVELVQGDVFDWSPPDGSARFDAVISDMAPATTGVRVTDHARSMRLVHRAMDLAEAWLRPGGLLLVKVFSGEDLGEFEARVRRVFRKVQRERPPAVRRESMELYVLGIGFSPGPRS